MSLGPRRSRPASGASAAEVTGVLSTVTELRHYLLRGMALQRIGQPDGDDRHRLFERWQGIVRRVP